MCIVAMMLGATSGSAQDSVFEPFQQGEKWGYRTSSGEVKIAPRFCLAHEFTTPGMALVVDGKGWAYIDRAGTIVVRPYLVNNFPDNFEEGLARFVKDGKIGFFDILGRIAINARFESADPFSNGRAAFCEGCSDEPARGDAHQGRERWGYIDGKGRVVVEPKYIRANSFLETGIAAIVDDKGWAYIDGSGKVLLRPFPFDNGPDYFEEGLARFVRSGKMGFFNRSGQIVIPARFEWVEPFSGGRARYCEGCKKVKEEEHYTMTGGRWGYIDCKGIVVVQPQ